MLKKSQESELAFVEYFDCSYFLIYQLLFGCCYFCCFFLLQPDRSRLEKHGQTKPKRDYLSLLHEQSLNGNLYNLIKNFGRRPVVLTKESSNFFSSLLRR